MWLKKKIRGGKEREIKGEGWDSVCVYVPVSVCKTNWLNSIVPICGTPRYIKIF